MDAEMDEAGGAINPGLEILRCTDTVPYVLNPRMKRNQA